MMYSFDCLETLKASTGRAVRGIPDETIVLSKPLIKLLEFVSERQAKEIENGLGSQLKESIEKINFQMFGPVQEETLEDKLPKIVKKHPSSRNPLLNPIARTSIDQNGHKTMKVSPIMSPRKEVKSPK